jgi:hypothetical protein
MLLRMFLGVVLITLLTGCNSSASTLSLASMLARASSVDTTPTDLSLNQGASFNLSSLNIIANGFTCALGGTYGGNPVLTDISKAYDAGSIQSLAASIDKGDPSLLPNGFAAVLGAFSSCDSIWEITNTGQDVVQITKIDLRYATDPQPNTYQYNLIDLCTLPIQTKASMCSGGRGGGGDVQTYSFQPGMGSTGTIVSSQETGSLSIDPGATVKVYLVVTPKDKSNPDYIYSIVPQLTLDTSSQPQDIPQMTSTIAFIDSNQVSCYQLQSDNTFLQVNNLPIPSGLDNNGNFVECV